MARRKEAVRRNGWIWDQFAHQGPGSWVERTAPGFVRVGTLRTLAAGPAFAQALAPAVEAGMVATIEEAVRRIEALPDNANAAECVEALHTMLVPGGRRRG